jgi:hypothetical protein
VDGGWRVWWRWSVERGRAEVVVVRCEGLVEVVVVRVVVVIVMEEREIVVVARSHEINGGEDGERV